MVKALDCGIVVSDFELRLRYCVNFETNTLGKSLNPVTPNEYPFFNAKLSDGEASVKLEL